MSKFFMVRMVVDAVIQADTFEDAQVAAQSNWRDIASDGPTPQPEVLREVKTLGDLNGSTWDSMCLPYNGDGNMRLSELLED